MQAEVAGALWGLSVNDDIEEAIAGANGIRVLVEAAKHHYGNAKVQARVAGALRKLSANDENKHEIAEADGIAAPSKVPVFAVLQLARCALPGRAWRLRAAGYSQSEAPATRRPATAAGARASRIA